MATKKWRPQTTAEIVASAKKATSVNVQSRGYWPPRQTREPEGIDWSHWTTLSSVKVFEALALLNGQEPPENCPDADDESPAYRKRMRLLVDALSNREWFGPPKVNSGVPLLQRVNLAEVGRWAKANGYSLPDEFPCAVAEVGATQNSGSASSDAVATTTKPDSSRITIAEAKRRILESSPRELFTDFYVGADEAITTVADGVPKSIFAGHLDEDFAGNCKKLGIVPSWKYRPGKTGYTGDTSTDDLYVITQGELDRLASLYGLSMEVGTLTPTVPPIQAAKQRQSAEESWKPLAQKLAWEFIGEQVRRDFYPSQETISDKVAELMRKAGIFGADGKPLSGATIKRHALKGISSAGKKALSTKSNRGN